MVKEYYFPISILQGILDNPNKALQDALAYALTEYAQSKGATKKDVEQAFDIRMGGSLNDNAKRVQNVNRKQPHTHIGRNAFWSFENRTKPNHPSEPPTEQELIVLLAQLGLYSIAGHHTEKDVQTTKAQLFARMQGYASYKDVPVEDARLTKWTTRKQFAKLKRLVEDISKIEFKDGHQRGITFIVHLGEDTPQESNERPF